MGKYNEYMTCYAIESTPGSAAITSNASLGYLPGAISPIAKHPSPITTTHSVHPAVNARETSSMIKGPYELPGRYTIRAQNAIPIWLALGGHSQTGPVSSVYTHTITPTTDGTAIPSFTIHHERTDAGAVASDWTAQFLGCKVNDLMLYHDMKEAPFLMYRMDVLARKAQKAAYTLTNRPALPATANSDSYRSLTRTWDYGSSDLDLDGLVSMELKIPNVIFSEYIHHWTGTDYDGHWPNALIETQLLNYELRLVYSPSGSDVWDELLATSNSKEMYFKWTRDTDDYIAMTLTNCRVIEHDLIVPEVGTTLLETVLIHPESVSVSVKDKINGAPYYGD